MSTLSSKAKLSIDTSKTAGAGRGVFAGERILAGSLIEECPVVALEDANDRARLRKTGLVNYYFLWGDKRDHAAICLGWGSVYNHSFEPNARYEKVMEDLRMDFYALRDIEVGEEIFVNYNGAPDNTTPLRIPGIPATEGGMPVSRTPRVVQGLMRRATLLGRWLSERPSSYLMMVAVAAC